MTEKGFDALQRVFPKYSSHVDKVIGSRDPNVQCDYYDEIAELCNHFGVRFFDKSDVFTVDSDYSIAIGWRWLITTSESDLIVFHDSLLPKYRGFAPVVSALINGEEDIGVTALYASKEYDRGDVIYQEKIKVTYPIKIQKMIEAISVLYGDIALKVFDCISMKKNIPSVVQDESLATYSLWRDEEDYLIDWNLDAKTIKRFIDAVGFPYNNAKTMVGSQCYRILHAEVIEDVVIENRTPGKVIFKEGNCPIVVCGVGLLKIHEMLCDQTGSDVLGGLKFRTRFTSRLDLG